MTKSKILCISNIPPPYQGSAIANAILLTNAMVNNKFNLKIIRLKKPILQLGGKLLFSSLFADFMTTIKLVGNIISFRPDLIYFGLSQNRLGFMRNMVWIWLATLGGSKVLCHLHGSNFREIFETKLGLLFKKIFRLSLALLKGVIVLDDSFKTLFSGLIREDKIFVLQNGVRPNFSESDLIDAMKQREKHAKLNITYLSNFVPGKGFDTFLEAVLSLKIRGHEHDFRFYLAGAAPNLQISGQIEEFCRSHDLGDIVDILGKVNDREKWPLLLNSDIFVFPTQLSEGQPIVILEALASGLPVISTARGCIPAMVHEGVNGFIVSERNPTEIADRLVLLKHNLRLRISMGQASRAIYNKFHTEERFIHGFISIFDRVLAAD